MSTTQQPETLRAAAQAVIDRWETPLWKDVPATAEYIAALRDALEADHFEDKRDMVARWYMIDKDGMATLCTDREDAEREAADAQRLWPHMGPHRAVQLVESADVEALHTGYAAARLEIESLQARIKTMAEEHADELMVAHLDGRMRAEQPAGAQQPGTVYAELPSYEHQRAIMEAERNASLDEYSRIVLLTSTESRIYERAFTNGWNRRASHGQAPAQAAPQQEAASVDLKTMELAESVGLIGPASRTNDLHAAIQRFHDLICANATIKAAQMAAEAISEAAPQADPLQPIVALQEQAGMYADDFAPQADSVTAPAAGAVAHTISDAQIEAMPVWRNFVGLWPESRREIVDAVVDLLAAGATAPAAQAADSVLEDAVRLDWLLLRISGAEFRRIGVHYSGNASRADVDAARKQGANHD